MYIEYFNAIQFCVMNESHHYDGRVLWMMVSLVGEDFAMIRLSTGSYRENIVTNNRAAHIHDMTTWERLTRMIIGPNE